MEARGIEPLSENSETGPSPSAVYLFLFPLAGAGKRAPAQVASLCMAVPDAWSWLMFTAVMTPAPESRSPPGERAALCGVLPLGSECYFFVSVYFFGAV